MSKAEEAAKLVPLVMGPIGDAMRHAIAQAAAQVSDELDGVQPMVSLKAEKEELGGAFVFILSVVFVPEGADMPEPVKPRYDA